MSFQERTIRQSEWPDFRVSFVRFEDGKARISVGVKEANSLNHNVLVEPSLNNQGFSTYSPWDDFYSQIREGPILNVIPPKEISQYTPGAPSGDTYVYPTDRLLEDGQFVIPMNTEIFFYIKISAQYSKDSEANIRNSFVGYPHLGDFDQSNQANNMRIEFGATVPADTPARINQTNQVWTYFFNLPIFKITVRQDGVDLKNYEIGECTFMSEDCLRQPNLLNFGKVSSYYD